MTPEEIDELRERLVAAGVECTEILDHDDSEWGASDQASVRGPRRRPPGPALAADAIVSQSSNDQDVAPPGSWASSAVALVGVTR